MQRNLDRLCQEGYSRELKEVALQAGLALTQAEYTYIQILYFRFSYYVAVHIEIKYNAFLCALCN